MKGDGAAITVPLTYHQESFPNQADMSNAEC
jgi:hypothetical protein